MHKNMWVIGKKVGQKPLKKCHGFVSSFKMEPANSQKTMKQVADSISTFVPFVYRRENSWAIVKKIAMLNVQKTCNRLSP